LPAFVTIAKLIPEDIESSVYAVIKGIQACSILVYGRLLGAAVGAAISKQKEISPSPVLMLALLSVSFLAAGILLCFLKLIPT